MATIPLSWNDPLFNGLTNSSSVVLANGGTLSNYSTIDNGALASVQFDGSATLNDVRINSREGVRIGGSGNITISNSYIETTGLAGDHADGIQAYDPGGTGNLTITNTTIVSHNNNATAGVWIADQYSGTFSFNNVVFEGGPYGLRIADDAKVDDYVSLNNVYFVGPFEYGAFLFQEVNANIHITAWNNVRYATIVNGVLVPGALIQPPWAVEGGGTTPPTQPTPDAPTIASGDQVTNHNTVTVTGTAAAGSTVAVFDGTTKLGTTTVGSNGAWTYTTTALTDGKHTFTATDTDTSSGATSVASSARVVTIDTHAPVAPVLVSDSVVNTNHVLLSGTAEANSTITVYDGTNAVGTATAGLNGAWSVTTSALASGSQVLTASATDAAGNTSAHSQALDPVIGSSVPPVGSTPGAPKIVSFSSDTGVAGDHITNDNTPTLTGTAAANTTVKVFDGSTPIGTTTANSSGAWTLTTKVALSDGTHSLTATDTDSSGHTSSASSALAITIDTHAPAAPTLAVYSQAGTAVGGTTTAADLLLKGTAEANSTIDVFDGGKQIGTATTSGSGAWSLDTGHLANGSHSFTAAAIDVAGNTSTASAADAVSVTAPPTSASKPIEFTNVDYVPWNNTATISGTADANSQIKLYDGTTSLGTVTASANGSWSLTAPNLSNTLHTIKAQELDTTGHVVETSSGAVILAAGNTSTLTGTGGDDFLFSSSSYVNDTFVFASNFGHSTIEGFTAAGSGQDTIQFSKSVFANFADVMSHAIQSGQNVVISDHAGDTLTLTHLKLSALNPHDFHFA